MQVVRHVLQGYPELSYLPEDDQRLRPLSKVWRGACAYPQMRYLPCGRALGRDFTRLARRAPKLSLVRSSQFGVRVHQHKLFFIFHIHGSTRTLSPIWLYGRTNVTLRNDWECGKPLIFLMSIAQIPSQFETDDQLVGYRILDTKVMHINE